jgi:organic hydroperoxide reductase OsmC/OhrA
MTDIGQSSASVPARVVRRGRVSWLTHPPAGEARIAVESRAFGATPVALPEGDPLPHEAAPGELLAVTHATFMAAALAEVLAAARSPATELVVSAECTFAGQVAERELVAVDLQVHGRVPGLDAGSFEEAVAAARERHLRSSGFRPDVRGAVRAVLRMPARAGSPGGARPARGR